MYSAISWQLDHNIIFLFWFSRRGVANFGV